MFSHLKTHRSEAAKASFQEQGIQVLFLRFERDMETPFFGLINLSLRVDVHLSHQI